MSGGILGWEWNKATLQVWFRSIRQLERKHEDQRGALGRDVMFSHLQKSIKTHGKFRIQWKNSFLPKAAVTLLSNENGSFLLKVGRNQHSHFCTTVFYGSEMALDSGSILWRKTDETKRQPMEQLLENEQMTLTISEFDLEIGRSLRHFVPHIIDSWQQDNISGAASTTQIAVYVSETSAVQIWDQDKRRNVRHLNGTQRITNDDLTLSRYVVGNYMGMVDNLLNQYNNGTTSGAQKTNYDSGKPDLYLVSVFALEQYYSISDSCYYHFQLVWQRLSNERAEVQIEKDQQRPAFGSTQDLFKQKTRPEFLFYRLKWFLLLHYTMNRCWIKDRIPTALNLQWR